MGFLDDLLVACGTREVEMLATAGRPAERYELLQQAVARTPAGELSTAVQRHVTSHTAWGTWSAVALPMAELRSLARMSTAEVYVRGHEPEADAAVFRVRPDDLTPTTPDWTRVPARDRAMDVYTHSICRLLLALDTMMAREEWRSR